MMQSHLSTLSKMSLTNILPAMSPHFHLIDVLNDAQSALSVFSMMPKGRTRQITMPLSYRCSQLCQEVHIIDVLNDTKKLGRQVRYCALVLSMATMMPRSSPYRCPQRRQKVGQTNKVDYRALVLSMSSMIPRSL